MEPVNGQRVELYFKKTGDTFGFKGDSWLSFCSFGYKWEKKTIFCPNDCRTFRYSAILLLLMLLSPVFFFVYDLNSGITDTKTRNCF